MESLLVIFAVLVGAAFADIPLKIDTDADAARAFPLTSSDYLKMVFDRSPGMDTEVIGRFDDLLDSLAKYGLSEAERIARSINLIDKLDNIGLDSLTLFAPTNDALRKWQQEFPLDPSNPRDQARLVNLVRAWIVPDMAVRLRDMQQDDLLLPTLTFQKLRINSYQNGQITVNGAPVVNGVDIQSNANFIHVVDKMIFPLPNGNIVQELDRAGHFTTLIKVIQMVGAQRFFSYANPLTIFAPTDKAWASVPDKKLADLLTNTTKLVRLVQYHTIRRTYYSAGFKDAQNIKSMSGDNIALSHDNVKDEYLLNQDPAQPDLAVRVIIPDIPARNGAIHVIDKVLDLPKKRQS